MYLKIKLVSEQDTEKKSNSNIYLPIESLTPLKLTIGSSLRTFSVNKGFRPKGSWSLSSGYLFDFCCRKRPARTSSGEKRLFFNLLNKLLLIPETDTRPSLRFRSCLDSWLCEGSQNLDDDPNFRLLSDFSCGIFSLHDILMFPS